MVSLSRFLDGSLFENFGERAIKSPEYHFTDTGKLCRIIELMTFSDDKVAPDCVFASEFYDSVAKTLF